MNRQFPKPEEVNMSEIFKGRYTATTDKPFVVFLIGMRINRLLAVRKWWPVMQAMVPMLTGLMRNPEKGFLGGRTLIGWRGPTLIQYWRSFEDLERFARDPADPHKAAWKMFYQLTGDEGSVGIWHETYQVNANQSESVYVNMPRQGLGEVMGLIPATGHRHSARGRLDSKEQASAEKLEVYP
jgi:hypothetical protein